MLRLVDLHKTYGSTTALDGCSFEARPGRLTGFLGPNGAGKTTTMRVIFGLAVPDSGTVHWQGEQVTAEHRQRFGYMPEERGLYPKMRVRDQLVYLGRLAGRSPSAALAKADAWLGALGLTDRADARVDQLSHGNQQRVQLAAALVHDPDLLVLDEPFSGLDPLAMDTMAGLLTDLARQGATVLFSSHQLDVVEDLCEDVVVVDHGRVVLAGTLDDLRNRAQERYLEVRVRTPLGTADVDWAGVLPGARLVHSDDEDDVTTVRFEVDRDVDLVSLVAKASSAGEVDHLTFQSPTLSELFRKAVGA